MKGDSNSINKKPSPFPMNTKLAVISAILASLSVFFSLDSVFHDSRISEMELLPLDAATGPESIAFDAKGEGPYTGISDGRILKWQGKEQRWLEYAAVHAPHLLSKCRGSQDPKLEHVCGRPLGLKFSAKTGELYVADAYLGLLVVGPDDKFATPIAKQAQSVEFHVTNGLDIDPDSGVVYFTDSSMRFPRRQYISAIIAGDRTGRLMKYDPESREVQVLLDSLYFPNGVALSQDGSHLLIVETTTCRILRYWLRTPKAKSLEVIAQLPGFPDNIKRSPRGGFWVALHSKRTKLVQWVLSEPWLCDALLKASVDLQRLSSFLNWRSGKASALRLSEDGQVLEGFGGRAMRAISEVEERYGRLWIGSIAMPFVGIYNVTRPA
ncbi:protein STRICTOSIDINE SYNTHASE-LIKE 10-like [Phoenix dactylifera]|uniref:Protein STRICTOSIDINE SYNTHASE-LIKE 10-like n=1 Tax=Phoenix dactylifera TaxID=42345 RepID=A0A8B7BIB2_PHODC|nr:protein STRICTOSIDINE SYNTHASE-LIKE 10-like [Phoenix dactylifera]